MIAKATHTHTVESDRPSLKSWRGGGMNNGYNKICATLVCQSGFVVANNGVHSEQYRKEIIYKRLGSSENLLGNEENYLEAMSLETIYNCMLRSVAQ